jgi:general secretion pathway protein C
MQIQSIKHAREGASPKGVGGKVELFLIALLAVVSAALCWATLAPLRPIGNWREPINHSATGSGAVVATFDPFFRLARSQSSVLTITPLDITVHGIREDLASGRGAAIIGTPDGKQRTIMTGEEIMPGITLNLVESDAVTISRVTSVNVV